MITATGIGAFGIVLNLPDAALLQVPPPAVPPVDSIDTINSDGLELWAEAIYWQDFMPVIPEEGPPFFIVIRVNITNTGATTVTDFNAIRVTMYFNGTTTPFATLNLTIVGAGPEWPQIAPGENVVLEFTNVRDSIFSPTIDEGTPLYSRVLVTWNSGAQEILTTAPSCVLYTY